MHHLPFLDPSSSSSSIPNSYSLTPKQRMMIQRWQNGSKLRKLNDDVEEDNPSLQMKEEPNITHAQTNKVPVVSELEAATALVAHADEEAKRASAKEQLYKLCGVKHWKAPMYECCDEDGPRYTRLFIVKATVEIKEDSRIMVLECFGDPQNKKKIAAEQAAEAALWFLKNVGHTLQTDEASGRKGRQKRFRRW